MKNLILMLMIMSYHLKITKCIHEINLMDTITSSDLQYLSQLYQSREEDKQKIINRILDEEQEDTIKEGNGIASRRDHQNEGGHESGGRGDHDEENGRDDDDNDHKDGQIGQSNGQTGGQSNGQTGSGSQTGTGGNVYINNTTIIQNTTIVTYTNTSATTSFDPFKNIIIVTLLYNCF